MGSRRPLDNDPAKMTWSGRVISIQPRIHLTRSFDQRTHSYQGYILEIQGTVGVDEQTFTVAIGKGAHDRQQFRVGDLIGGTSEPVRDSRTEVAEYYKTIGLKVEEHATRFRKLVSSMARCAFSIGSVSREGSSKVASAYLRDEMQHLHLGVSHESGNYR